MHRRSRSRDRRRSRSRSRDRRRSRSRSRDRRRSRSRSRGRGRSRGRSRDRSRDRATGGGAGAKKRFEVRERESDARWGTVTCRVDRAGARAEQRAGRLRPGGGHHQGGCGEAAAGARRTRALRADYGSSGLRAAAAPLFCRLRGPHACRAGGSRRASALCRLAAPRASALPISPPPRMRRAPARPTALCSTAASFASTSRLRARRTIPPLAGTWASKCSSSRIAGCARGHRTVSRAAPGPLAAAEAAVAAAGEAPCSLPLRPRAHTSAHAAAAAAEAATAAEETSCVLIHAQTSRQDGG